MLLPSSAKFSKRDFYYHKIKWWFEEKGIVSKDIQMETIGNFCQSSGFGKITKKTREQNMTNFVMNNLDDFYLFASDFLKENNYL